MLDRYWVFPRKNGVFYFQDKITGKQQSTRTKDKVVAERLLWKARYHYHTSTRVLRSAKDKENYRVCRGSKR